MPAKIQTIIPASKFELIRDQLGAVLALEIAGQKSLDNTLVAPDKVWVGRFVPFNTKTEFPAINVRYQNGVVDERSREVTQAHYIHSYFVDVMFCAKSTDATQGDQRATIQLERLIGIVRAVLMSPEYFALGFSLPFCKRSWVNSIVIDDPMEFQDGLNQISGRVEYCIEVPELGMITNEGVPLNEVTTQVKINETEKGNYWDYIA